VSLHKSTGEYVRSNPKVIQNIKTEMETTKCKRRNIYKKTGKWIYYWTLQT